MYNSHAVGAADQTLTDSLLLQKYRYAFRAEVRDDCEPMRVDDF